jgi:arsenate reductase
MKVLILCTGNSCRSQMAEGFLKSFDENLEVFSAGTKPAVRVHPMAIKVMNEAGIDISKNHPKNVDEFLNDSFDYVITVCDEANEACPFFYGKVRYRLHFRFEDPAAATGSEEEVLTVFKRVRDKIKDEFNRFFKNNIERS